MIGDPRKEIEEWCALHGIMTFEDLRRLVAKERQSEQFAAEARALFDRISASVGAANAAAIFNDALPQRLRGNPRDMATGSENARASYHDLFNRAPGPDGREPMTARESAADIHRRFGYSNSPDAAYRRLKRLARTRRIGDI
jgi:hypothetical protein